MVWDDDWLRECATNACFQLPTGREEDGQLGDGFRLRHIYPAWCNIILSIYIIYILVGVTSLYPHIICIYPAWCIIVVSTYCIYPGLILFSSPYIWSVTWLWFPICQNRCPCHQIYVTWIMKKLFTRFRSAWIKSGQMVPTVNYIYCYVALEDRCEKCLGLQIRSVLGRDSYKSS